MTVETRLGTNLDGKIIAAYFDTLVNKFFKILPIREQNCDTLGVYIESLRAELVGGKSLIHSLGEDASYLTLLFILEYLTNEQPDVPVVKREVFKAIGICNKIRDSYLKGVSG